MSRFTGELRAVAAACTKCAMPHQSNTFYSPQTAVIIVTSATRKICRLLMILIYLGKCYITWLLLFYFAFCRRPHVCAALTGKRHAQTQSHYHTYDAGIWYDIYFHSDGSTAIYSLPLLELVCQNKIPLLWCLEAICWRWRSYISLPPYAVLSLLFHIDTGFILLSPPRWLRFDDRGDIFDGRGFSERGDASTFTASLSSKWEALIRWLPAWKSLLLISYSGTGHNWRAIIIDIDETVTAAKCHSPPR